MMVKLVFPDGSSKEYAQGTTGTEVAASISRGLAKKALCFSVDGVMYDMSAPVVAGAIRIITFEDEVGAEVLRHSASHLLAAAVRNLYPGARFGIGPAIRDGFYYDMDIPDFPGSSALDAISAEMKRLVGLNIPFERAELSLEEAVTFFESMGERFKVELLREIGEKGEKVSIYRLGSFVDLCRGPHVPSSGYLKHTALLSVAGAYWRGDENNKMLTRIYGTAFDTGEALAGHLELLEEAKRRDHRKLGPELGLFTIGGPGGPGLAYWLPNGTALREELEGFWKEAHRRQGYKLVVTPHMAPAELWKTSGHYDYYRENMYFTEVEKGEYAIKPMNCPGHIIIYQNEKRSYRELPLRLAELGTVYRCERSGVLHGLMRVRGFTVDDGHIFCTADQMVSEVQGVIRFALFFLRLFGFGYEIELSLSDPDNMDHYAGVPEEWARAEKAMADALDEMGEKYKAVLGEAAFYGPKVDIKMRDALGRMWQGPTIQFDFNIPARFNLTYVGDDGKEQRVYMVHRALFGSEERFIGNLIEHFGGNFPGWLAPVQLIILPITSSQHEYARKVETAALEAGIRCTADLRSGTIGYRIREAETRKVPFMFVLGETEAREGTVAPRRHGKGDLGAMSLENALRVVLDDCARPSFMERR